MRVNIDYSCTNCDLDYIKDFVKLIVIKRQFSKWAYDRYDPLFGSCQIAISALIASLFTLIPDLIKNSL